MSETKQLSFLDRYLTVWIFAAMGLGLWLGHALPQFGRALTSMSVGTTSIPIAIGLIVMMFPPLTKVRYGKAARAFHDDKKVAVHSFIENWIVGPVVMMVLAILFLRDTPGLMSGVILIGLARCIAMVIVWNDLADGDRECCAAMVGMNSLLQIFLYAGYAWLFVLVLPKALGLPGVAVDVSTKDVAVSVGIYLGIPCALGYLTQKIAVATKGEDWFTKVLVPAISPLTLIALLATIVVMFALKGGEIMAQPSMALRVAVPLLIYFVLMFAGSLFASRVAGIAYEKAVTLAFTAASNNFELAIAVAVGVFGIASDQAFAAVIGPLVEVPVMIALVTLVKKVRPLFVR